MTYDGQKKVDVVGCYTLIIGFPVGRSLTLPSPPYLGIVFHGKQKPFKDPG